MLIHRKKIGKNQWEIGTLQYRERLISESVIILMLLIAWSGIVNRS
jgi:hypothetical protein